MDSISLIVEALIDKGGIWGAIASLLFFWNVHKETSVSKKENKIKDETVSQRERYLQRERDFKSKIEELEKSILALQEENRKILKTLSETERERVDDLKDLLSSYHTTASSTLQALEKFEFFITNNKRG
jgi:hypothetical protein